MPIKFNFGMHDVARDAEERFPHHFKEADAFIFEHAEEMGFTDVDHFIKHNMSTRAKKDVVDACERGYAQMERDVDDFLEKGTPLPSHFDKYAKRSFELLKEENHARKAINRKPVRHAFEPFDRKIIEAALEYGLERLDLVKAFCAGDKEKFVSTSATLTKTSAEMDLRREQLIGRFASSFQGKRDIHVGVELGVAHHLLHDSLLREGGKNLLEPSFQPGSLEKIRQTLNYALFDSVRRGEALNQIECAAHQLAISAYDAREPDRGEKIDHLAKSMSEEHVTAILAKAKKSFITPDSVQSFVNRTCKELGLPV